MPKINVGLYGVFGHQIQRHLVDNATARLAAVANFPEQAIPEPLRDDKSIARYETLDKLLADDSIQIVSLCSKMRCDQARDAIQCLKTGKHVYAEKPCATTEEDLDAIMKAAEETGCRFHEMAGTAFAQPYFAMRQLVMAGEIGEVVQVIAQKAYPFHDKRPQDENKDGGLTCQVGIHALRFVEHITGLKISTMDAQETQLGNPLDGELRMASTMMMRLKNGALAVATANYLNPKGVGIWGYNLVRVFGTKGLVECSAPGNQTRLVVGAEDRGEVDQSEPVKDYFDMIVDSLLDGPPMPLTMDEELHPTRMVIRARKIAQGG